MAYLVYFSRIGLSRWISSWVSLSLRGLQPGPEGDLPGSALLPEPVAAAGLPGPLGEGEGTVGRLGPLGEGEGAVGRPGPLGEGAGGVVGPKVPGPLGEGAGGVVGPKVPGPLGEGAGGVVDPEVPGPLGITGMACCPALEGPDNPMICIAREERPDDLASFISAATATSTQTSLKLPFVLCSCPFL